MPHTAAGDAQVWHRIHPRLITFPPARRRRSGVNSRSCFGRSEPTPAPRGESGRAEEPWQIELERSGNSLGVPPQPILREDRALVPY